MRKYGPEAEKEQFVQEYRDALSLTPLRGYSDVTRTLELAGYIA